MKHEMKENIIPSLADIHRDKVAEKGNKAYCIDARNKKKKTTKLQI